MTVDRDKEAVAKGRKKPGARVAASKTPRRSAAKAAEGAAPRKADPKPAPTLAPPHDPVPAPAGDFEVAAENMARLVDQGRKVLEAAMGGDAHDEARSEFATNVADATRTLGQVAEHWLAKPEKAARAQADLFTGLTDIWSQTLRRLSGEEAAPIVPSDPSDKRFTAAEWRESPFFDWLRQSYILASRWADDMVEGTEGLDPQTRAKAAFYMRLISSAVSPSNFVATNPELLRATLAAKGENLVRGMKMLTEDLAAGGGVLKIRQSDESKFELGVDMANTPGKVIWRNEVMELIQYAPTTREVYARPLLIVPPWINKFYVLDLNAEKSFVRWAVAQGLTVFIVSWVNPDERQASKGFDAYMHEGVLAALDAIEKATGEKKIAAAGYCVGGTLLAATLAYMAAKGDDRIDSRDLLRGAGRFLRRRRHADFLRRKAARRARREHGQDRLSRRRQNGQRLQPAAAERTHLELCRQQLHEGRRAGGLRSARMEFGLHAHSTRQPLLLSAQLLSREQSLARRDGHRRREARSAQGENPGL